MTDQWPADQLEGRILKFLLIFEESSLTKGDSLTQSLFSSEELYF